VRDFSIYEVGPRDGLQNASFSASTEEKIQLIRSLANAGLTDMEVGSFVHPQIVPSMADSAAVFEEVADYGDFSVLIPNDKGLDRALAVGVENFNIFFSPSEAFNLRNLGRTREDAMKEYLRMLDKIPDSKVRVYLSVIFGCPFEGKISDDVIYESILEASLLGDTVVLCDTIGQATKNDIQKICDYAEDFKADFALHLHHKPNENERALALVEEAIAGGITEIDASIGGLGGCPFIPGSSGNVATEQLVNLPGYDCGIDSDSLLPSLEWISKRKQKVIL
jgi:hydroxymethylglutaryl-CoA lyase